MTSEKQAQANRHNAEASTGPRTTSGKQRSRGNALKSGIFAQVLLLPTENRREFQRLRTELFEMYAPVGPVEEAVTREIMGAIWRLNRIDIAEAENLKQLSRRLEKPMCSLEELMHNNDPEGTLLRAFAPTGGGPPIDEISRQRRLVMRDLLGNVESLSAMQAKRNVGEVDKS